MVRVHPEGCCSMNMVVISVGDRARCTSFQTPADQLCRLRDLGTSRSSELEDQAAG